MIEKVVLENWKSHHETELEFSEGVNTLVGTMGSGKSSVLEALTFALYGTTPGLKSREIKLEDVIRRSPSRAQEARVKTWINVDGESYSVERKLERGNGTKRAELRKDGELVEGPSTTEVTEQVEKIIGMDFHSFTRAVYSEQNNLDLFLEMRPGDRKEKIDELLKLERFEDARQTAVKVENRLKNELEQKQEDLSELEESIDREEIENLEEDVSGTEEKIKETREKIEELEEELEEKNENLEKMEEKKQKHEELEERLTRLETRQESLQERIDEKEAIEVENPSKKLESKKEKKKRLMEQKEEINKKKQELEHLEEKKGETEERIEKLEEQIEKFSKLEDIEEKLEEKTGELEEKKEQGAKIQSRKESIEESLEELEDLEGDCPTCGQELDEEHRKKLVKERREESEELSSREEELKEQVKNLMDEVDDLEEKRDRLMEFQGAEEKLEDFKEKGEKLEEKMEETEEELEELEEEWSGELIEKVEKEIEKLEDAVELGELEEKRETLEEKLEDTGEEKEKLDFDRDVYEELEEKVSEIKQEIELKTNSLESSEELLEEKKRRLEKLREQIEKSEELEKEIKHLDRLLDYIDSYREALNETQVAMRQRFVRRLNELMEQIWSQVYPYDDYYAIRLNAEEGYLLQLLDSEDNWISAEAEVSGGERHSAALVLRLALTFALSPKIQMLMLDEPTHNLDSSAVDELSETLRERTSELINQLFVVTHDSSLESSATGKLYRFRKKNTEAGLTEVEEVL